VVAGASGEGARAPRGGPEALAAAWLASLVEPDGRVVFAIDPRARRRIATGVMAHGRAAVAVQALAAHGDHDALVRRARGWLERDLRAGLRGEVAEGFVDAVDLESGRHVGAVHQPPPAPCCRRFMRALTQSVKRAIGTVSATKSAEATT